MRYIKNKFYDFIYWFVLKYGEQDDVNKNWFAWPYFKYNWQWFNAWKEETVKNYICKRQVYVAFFPFNKGWKVKYKGNWVYGYELEEKGKEDF